MSSQSDEYCSPPQLFDPLLNPSTIDGEAEGDDGGEVGELDGWAGRDALVRLLQFCQKDFKSEMVKMALCGGALDEGKHDCINGTCHHCGFRKLWSQGLKPHVINGSGHLKDDAPVEFQSQLRWTRVTSSKKKASGPPVEAKELMHQVRTGTLVEFLDEFERDVMRKFPHHKYTILRQKSAAAQFIRARWPGWLQSDVDFAENGDIISSREVQSEYWVMQHYTLFMQVVSFLITSEWIDRSGSLARGCMVTVEPPEASVPGST